MMHFSYVIENHMDQQQKKFSGVDTDTFTTHSCRSASTSKAMSSGVALDVILKAGQWSVDSTFYQFYRKDIVKSGNLVDITFAESLINTTTI